MGERSCGEQANQRAGDPAGFLLAPGSSGRIICMRLSPGAQDPPDPLMGISTAGSELRQAV